jgi:hypothetical protein
MNDKQKAVVQEMLKGVQDILDDKIDEMEYVSKLREHIVLFMDNSDTIVLKGYETKTNESDQLICVTKCLKGERDGTSKRVGSKGCHECHEHVFNNLKENYVICHWYQNHKKESRIV